MTEAQFELLLTATREQLKQLRLLVRSGLEVESRLLSSDA